MYIHRHIYIYIYIYTHTAPVELGHGRHDGVHRVHDEAEDGVRAVLGAGLTLAKLYYTTLNCIKLTLAKLHRLIILNYIG